MKAWINVDEDGRVTSSTTYEKFKSDDSIEVELDDDFDFMKQSDYVYKDGNLEYDGAVTNEQNAAREAESSAIRMGSQISLAAQMFVQSSAKDMSDKQAALLDTLFKEWEVGLYCENKDIVRYKGKLYRIGVNHSASDTYHPGDVGTESMYSLIKIDDDGYEYWKDWDGISGYYNEGDVTRDPNDEQLYVCIKNNCTYGPPSEVNEFWKLYEK